MSFPPERLMRPSTEVRRVFQRMLRQIFPLAAIPTIQGCVSLHAPLEPDQTYPADWPPVSTLGAECKAIAGTYANEGTLAVQGDGQQAITLMSILNLQQSSTFVALDVHTRKIDAKGDAFITLAIEPDAQAESRFELKNCFCVRETLACPNIAQSSWSFPFVGLGGSQKNLYLSIADDASLIAKLQNYHVDLILAIPVFGDAEPWARFESAAPIAPQ